MRAGSFKVFHFRFLTLCHQGWGFPANTAPMSAQSSPKQRSLDVIEQLEAANAVPTAPENNPELLPPVELIQYVLDKHHTYLRAELSRIEAMSERVAKVHGGHTPTLVEVFHIFCAMAEELDGHMMKKEQILFSGDSDPLRR